MSAKPFVRNKKFYFPLGSTSVKLLKVGESFLKSGSKVPYTVVNPDHNMGIQCKKDGESDSYWFDKSYPVTQLMVNRVTLSDHIIIRDGKVWLSKDYLVHLGMKESTVRQSISRNTRGIISSFENIKISKSRYINYDSINWTEIKPFKFGTPYPEKNVLADQVSKEKNELLEEESRETIQNLPNLWNRYYDQADERWYREEHRVNEGRAGDHNRSEDLATGMAILRFLSSHQTKSSIKALGINGGKKDLQTSVGQYLASMNPPLFGFPTSYDRIRKLVSKYIKCLEDKEDTRSLLLHGNTGNSNRKKLDETQELVMRERYLQPNKPDMWASWRDYVNYFLQQGWEESDLIGYTRFKQYFSTPEMRLIASKVRDGSAYYDSHFRPFVLGRMPEHSMSLISGDGWEPGRSVKFKWLNKQGKLVDRVGTMNVWYWADWKSKYICSHRISGFENSKDIRQSFRDILAMHEGRVPRSIMIDKKWAKQGEVARMLKKAGVMIQEKEAYHPQTNYIERINKEMNKLHRQLDEHWVDMTNNNHRFKHNDDHVRGVKPLTEDEFHKMVIQLIHLHNNTPYKSLNGKTPREVFFDSISPECKVIDPMQQSWIFGDHRITTLKQFMAKIDIATRKYVFVVPNEQRRNVIKEIGKDWKVKVYYDERHMETADLYAFSDPDSDHTDRYLCTAQNAENLRVNRSKIEAGQDPEHNSRLGYQQAGIKEVDGIIEDFMEEHEASARRLNIDLASVKAVSQEKYKEAMSNSVAQAYNRYYEDQLDMVYEEVNDNQSQLAMDVKKKRMLLEKQIGNEFSEDPQGESGA